MPIGERYCVPVLISLRGFPPVKRLSDYVGEVPLVAKAVSKETAIRVLGPKIIPEHIEGTPPIFKYTNKSSHIHFVYLPPRLKYM